MSADLAPRCPACGAILVTHCSPVPLAHPSARRRDCPAGWWECKACQAFGEPDSERWRSRVRKASK